MKKRTKQLITAAAALAVLSVIFLVSSGIEKKKAREEEAAREAEREASQADFDFVEFIDIPAEEIVRVEMDFPGEKALFEKNGDIWNLSHPSYETVQSAVDSAARGVSGIGSSTVVEEDVADWSVYGIGPDSGRTTVTSADGRQVTVILGDRTPTGSGYYACPEGDTSVYMVYAYSAENLMPDISSLRDHSLPGINAQAVTYVKAEGDRTIELMPYDIEEEFANSFSAMMMVQPYEEPCGISTDRLGRYLEAMVATPLTKIDFVDDYSSLGDLGLDEAHVRRVTYRDQENNSVTLLVGKAVTNEEYVNASEQPGQYTTPLGPRAEYYAMQPDREEVFTVSGAWAGLLEADPFSIRDGFVRLVNIDDIESFSFAFKGKTWGGRIERDGEGEDLSETYFFNGAEASEDDFKDIYQDLLYIIYEGEADPSFKLGKIAPEATVRYIGTQEHGGDTRADFYNYDDQYYIVSVDGGESRFLVGRYQIGDIVKNLSSVDF